MKNLITIGLPSKGRLKDKAISFSDRNGLKILQSKKERNYFGTIKNKSNIKIIFLHAKEISFFHPVSETTMRFEAPLQPELEVVLQKLGEQAMSAGDESTDNA